MTHCTRHDHRRAERRDSSMTTKETTSITEPATVTGPIDWEATAELWKQRAEMTEQGWRHAIAEQVRRNCTPSADAYAKGGDTLIAAMADWIENPPGWSELPPVKEAEPAILAPEDFTLMYDADHVFPFVESEDGTIIAYGHPDREQLTQQITQYDLLCVYPHGDTVDPTEPDDVEQTYAVVVEGRSGDEWAIRWLGIDERTPGAFPVSVVAR